MSNPWFDTRQAYVPNTTARGEFVAADFDGVIAAFDAINLALTNLTNTLNGLTNTPHQFYNVAAGSANAFVITPSPVITLGNGITIMLEANHTIDGPATLDEGNGAKAINDYRGSALVKDQITNKDRILLVYDLANTYWRMMSREAQTIQTGTIYAYGSTTAPTGSLLCDGSAVSRTTYAALFAKISTSNGAGDGSTTFNLPDHRGRIAAGLDNMGGSSANRITNSAADSLGGTYGYDTHAPAPENTIQPSIFQAVVIKT